MSNDMDEIIMLIEDMLDRDISWNLKHFDYEIFQYVDGFDYDKVIQHFEKSEILRYDYEHNTTIIEIIGGYLLIREEEVFNYIDIHICYCRYNIAIPRALCFISA